MTQTSTDNSAQFAEPISPPTAEAAPTITPPLLERQGSFSKVAHIAKKMVQSPSAPEPTNTETLNGRTVQEAINSVKSDKPTDVQRMEA